VTLDLRAADRDARARAQTDFDRPLVLEAGAGTGKTAALVARVVAWSVGPGWLRYAALGDGEQIAARVLGRIVAITFTEAAAQEMAARVARAFEALARGECPPGVLPAVADAPDVRVRSRALGESVDRLVVRTIHGFCHRILATTPLEVGLHPAFRIDADGAALAGVVREIVDDDLRAPDRGDAWKMLAARGIDPIDVGEALETLLSAGATEGVLEASLATAADLEALEGRMREALRRLGEAIGDDLEFVARVDAAQRVLAWARAALDEPRGEERPRIDPLVRDRLLSWARGIFTESERNVLDPERVRTAAADLVVVADHRARVDPVRLEEARVVLAPLLREAATLLRSRGFLTFQSLLEDAVRLLVGDERIAARARGDIDQLLVDEFQDTDQLQCELVRVLALRGERRPGLFVVGDPKQSIYGWRSADLEAYEDLVAEIASAGGDVRALSLNFRSAPAILDEVERIVAPVMIEEQGIQPAFRPLAAHRTEATGFASAPWAPVEHWVTSPWRDGAPVPGPSALLSTELEARAIALDLRTLHERQGVAWSDAAILLRSTTDLDLYLSALREQGIPYEVDRDRTYFLRREVIEAGALLRTVVDPTDPVAFLTLLRSAWVGVPDRALGPLWRANLPALAGALDGSDEAALGAALAAVNEVVLRDPTTLRDLPQWPTALAHALRSLHAARRSWAEDEVAVFLRRVRDLFLVEVTESARYLGAYRLANIEGLFRSVERALHRSDGAVTEVLELLRRSIKEAREAPEELVQTATADAVRVMTVHRAKGLDFDHTYVAQLGKESRPRALARNRFVRAPRTELVLFGVPTPGFDLVDRLERDREVAERVRLLYVATTRARERLVLCGAWPLDGDPPPVSVSRSFLDLVRRRTGGAAIAELAAAPAEGRFAHARGGAAWVFPGAWSFPALQSERAGRDLAVDPLRARAHREMLDEDRRRARARTDRPLVGGVTALGARESVRAGDLDEVVREEAAIAGTILHAVLERMDHALDANARLAWATAEAERRLGVVPEALRPGVQRRTRDVLAALAGGRVLARLHELALHIVGRELPLVLPPEERHGPLQAVTGAIDLLYRDPLGGALVVVDYKTGRQREADTHAAQGTRYARAIRDALGLAAEPRFEAWYLAWDEHGDAG
jgi:ATP-dependent helicase/nuclease subunit A